METARLNPILVGAAALAVLSVVLFAFAGLAWEVPVIAFVALGMVYLATRPADTARSRHGAPAVQTPGRAQEHDAGCDTANPVTPSPTPRFRRIRTFLGISLGLAAGSGGVFWALQNDTVKSKSFQWFESAISTARQLSARHLKKARP